MEDGEENPADVTCESNKVINDEMASKEEEEGCHMTHLRQALDKTIKKCLSSVRYSSFKDNFRPLHNHNAKALRSIKEQVVQQLESNIFDEMTHMFEEENIISLMNGLDGFKEYPGVAWRPIGNPPIDVRSHVLPAQEKHRDQLAAILKELESRNRMLQETVRSRQQKLYSTREKIEEELAVWQKAEDAVPKETLDSIRENVQTLSFS